MRALAVAAAAAILFACLAGAARADVAAIADDGADPWASGIGVSSPLETVAGTIASRVAGRPVSVRCESDADWAALGSLHRFAPSQVLGFVSFVGSGPVDFAELSPDICRSLQTFAVAAAKPTKCATTASLPQYVPQTVRDRVVKRVNGKPRVVGYRTHTVQKLTYVQVAQAPAPCFAGGRELTSDGPFWDAYFSTAEAIQTLVHESVHLQGDGSEAEAECYGMQWIAYAAQQLGDTPDDASAIAQYYATRLYPQRRSQSPAYWSADCVQNGRLDLTPNDGVWP